MAVLLAVSGCGQPLVTSPDDSGLDAAPPRDTGIADSAVDSGTDGGAPACATGCLVGTTCHPDGTANPTNPCEICDRDRSATSFVPNDGATCDDGEFCTTEDECSDRSCSGVPLECDDGIACNGTATCDETAGACLPGTTTCVAGELCDAVSGACVTTCPGCSIGTNCFGDGQVNPTNACEECNVAMSRTAFSVGNEGESCDDGTFCTSGDVCAAGVCAGPGAACGDTVDCNGTETCDETGDTCVAGTTTCGAAQVCDVGSDTCVATCTGCVIGGVCFGDGQRNPTNQCEVCAVATSRTAFTSNGGATCDDGQFCTSGDVCTGTVCGGAARVCSDGIACNGAETCNEGVDACRPGTATCGGGTVCDPGTDSCVGTCGGCTIAGSCFAVGQVNPMNPCEVCRIATPTVWSANTGASCDDALFCTTADVCTAARTCVGAARVCLDTITCNGTETCSESMDRCLPGTTTCAAGQVCNTTTPPGSCVATCTGCVVGGTCYAQGTTNPLNSCEICDTARSTSAFSANNGATCDDGLFCTRSDVCSGGLCAGSSANFCADAVTCNGMETCSEATDRCVAGATTCAAGQVCNVATNMCVTACTGCTVSGVCYAAGTTDPANSCQICDLARSSTAFSPNTGATCSDGRFCTAVDTCNSSAVCVGAARDCSDGVACTGTETCDEDTDSCDAGTTTCAAGSTCDLPSGMCILSCAGCVIAGQCYAPDSPNPGNPCQACRTLTSTTAWTNVANGTSCDDGAYCSTASACTTGTCMATTARNCSDGYTCNGLETCDEGGDRCMPNACVGAPCCTTGRFCDVSGPTPGTCSSVCPGGTICGTTCTSTATDANNCGGCSSCTTPGCGPFNCPDRPNTTRLCAASTCGYACLPGFLDCNGGTDGCEASALTDEMHCGTCSTVCGASELCIDGTCQVRGCYTGPARVLVYGPGGTIGSTMFPAGTITTVASDATWRTLTTADFGQYDIIFMDGGNCTGFGSGPAALYGTAEDTLAAWGPAVTGRIELITGDPDLHRDGGAAMFYRNSVNWLRTEGRNADGGHTSLFFSWGCSLGAAPIGGRGSPERFASVLGSPIATNNTNFCTAMTTPFGATHPVTAGLSYWGCPSHAGFAAVPTGYDVLAWTINPTAFIITRNAPAVNACIP